MKCVDSYGNDQISPSKFSRTTVNITPVVLPQFVYLNVRLHYVFWAACEQ